MLTDGVPGERAGRTGIESGAGRNGGSVHAVRLARDVDEFVGGLYQHAQGDDQPCIRVPLWAIPLTSSNPAQATLSAAALTFTAANWNIGQTVTVTGVDDFAPRVTTNVGWAVRSEGQECPSYLPSNKGPTRASRDHGIQRRFGSAFGLALAGA